MSKAIEVLLIEDNPADAYLACEYLNDTGYFVLVTKLQDGKAAIDFFEQVHGGFKKMPDLVLLDLNLPKQNGQEVLEFIRRQDKEVTVVIYSGSTSPMDRQRAENSKVNGYLVKPMTGDEMDEVVFQLKKVLYIIKPWPKLLSYCYFTAFYMPSVWQQMHSTLAFPPNESPSYSTSAVQKQLLYIPLLSCVLLTPQHSGNSR